MTRCDVAKIVMMIMLLVLVGCSTKTDLGGSVLPNSRPETRVTGQPPTLLEAGFAVTFNWTGTDPDGRIVGYQWKISDDGIDGISPRDTLTVDPLTGAEINPWHFTTATDTTFIVTADQTGFEGDPEGFERSFRTHSFFIRSVDEKGAVDPTPDLISFTSTTIVPRCTARFPNLPEIINSSFTVPPTVNFTYNGDDSDFESGIPTHIRFLKTAGEYWDGTEYRNVTSKYRYDLYADLLIDFDDPEWSLWEEFQPLEDNRKVSYTGGVNGQYYLFAVQVRDTAGAVSIGKGYGSEVLNYSVLNTFRPQIWLNEYFLGGSNQTRSFDIPAGQPLNFTWRADGTAYNGNIVSMRHGWDLADVDDENDPGWAVPPGMASINKFATERVFSVAGNHDFWVKVVDDSGSEKVLSWNIRIIPFVSRENQSNLAFVDQNLDENSGRWPSESGTIYYDDQANRNEYWEFLEGSNGVNQYSIETDRFDHNDSFGYEDLVKYKAVILSARTHPAQRIFNEFRPTTISGSVTLDKFVWLGPYQRFGGNLFLLGSQSMESFLEVRDYMVPIIFESTSEFYSLDDQNYVVGFGEKETPDGSIILRGPLMYPFETAGIAALDWNVPLGKNIYGRRPAGLEDRTIKCSGLKEIRLVEAFRSNHLIGNSEIVDVIGTNPLIDWRDPPADAGLDTMLTLGFPFSGDEFVDAKIAERPEQINLQACDEGYNGLCIEPMFTGVTRIDWMREQIWATGNEDWPGNVYANSDLKEICGQMALSTYVTDEGVSIPLATARANGMTYGYLSYKTITDKPGSKADVYWGFDPYRFDRTETQKAVMWVMNHFGLQLNSGN